MVRCERSAKDDYAEGERVRLTPRPDSGYRFDRWSGDAYGGRLVMDLVMDGNKSVTAHFKTWEPPIGIPSPSFGITETYRMYDVSQQEWQSDV